jgi:peroxiredoxin Q/BCP
MTIAPGDLLPDLECDVTETGTLRLSSLIGRWVVLYFYPKDSTPGCTTEGLEFNALYDEFQERNAVIFGISRDSIKSHERFREKQGFRFQLISDPDETLCKHFDVIREKKLYGRTYMGIERSTFLFNPEGKLVKVWRKVKVKGHAQDVLEAIREATAQQE